mmetsp:Transcript_5389/g.8517  ORF Transcript_5389/g.8517 Transcript_5389/m.8517 type:complete len:258 (-) Transcript_5389:106-879(-)
MRVDAARDAASGPNLKVATAGVGLPMASTMISAAVSDATSIGTVLPFSAISGAVRVMSPAATSAPPVKAAMASSAIADARSGNPATNTAPAPIRIALRLVSSIDEPPHVPVWALVLERDQIGDHVFDLLRAQKRAERVVRRFACVSVAGADEAFGLVEGGHQALLEHHLCVGHDAAQVGFAPTVARAIQHRANLAVKGDVGQVRDRVAGDAIAQAFVADNLAPLCWIAGHPGQRGRNGAIVKRHSRRRDLFRAKAKA